MDELRRFQLQPISIFFYSAVIILIVVAWKRRSSKSKVNATSDIYYNNLPPSPPWKLPVIGHMLHLLGSPPHHRLRDLAKTYGPHLMFLQLGETRNVVVSSAESAREVMKTHDLNFANRPVMLAGTVIVYDSSDVALAPYGAYWRQLKKICTVELLSSKRVQSFRYVREEEVSRYVDRILSSTSAGCVVDLTKETRMYTSTVIARSAFGEKCGEAEEFMCHLKDAMVLTGGFNVNDMFPSMTWLHVLFGFRSRMEKVSRGLDKILAGIINEHKRRRRRGHDDDVEERGDFVDILLKIQENGELEIPLTDDNIKAITLDMFTGGSDTTSSTIDWAMSEMLRNPRVLNKAQEEVRQHPHLFNASKNIVEEANIGELKYLKLVIKEALRLHPPVAMLVPRENVERCEINGYTIPAKTKVIVNAWAIGRDPKYWTQPNMFYPERFIDSDLDYKGLSFEYIPFGAGRRMCPGITFGTTNVELVLANLLYHFDWVLPNEKKFEDLDMTERFGITVYRKTNLCLVPTPYRPNA
ncbi:Premnaspirodiene oxygenase [Linum perenne]